MKSKIPNKYWKDKNVFITGCTGLLGSWLIKALVDKEANVIGLVRDSVPKSNLYRLGLNNEIITIKGELENYFIMERVLNEYEVDTVFHLGAQTIVGTANRNPISTFDSNIKGTWNLLEACRKSKNIEKIVFASSDKAYGAQDLLPYDEETPLEGRHPYDVSKSCADLLCKSYYHSYHLPVCITRCGNFFGGGDLNFNRIVPGTIRSILNDERPIIRSDGSLIRDYFYIEDGVEAYLTLAENMDNKKILGEAFNFSNEEPLSVLEIVNKILKIMESNLNPLILNETFNEIDKQYLSAKKARNTLKWHSLYNLEQGLKKTVEWYEMFFSG